jgi:hypothetical protein
MTDANFYDDLIFHKATSVDDEDRLSEFEEEVVVIQKEPRVINKKQQLTDNY